MHCVGLLFEEIRENLHMSILVLVEGMPKRLTFDQVS